MLLFDERQLQKLTLFQNTDTNIKPPLTNHQPDANPIPFNIQFYVSLRLWLTICNPANPLTSPPLPNTRLQSLHDLIQPLFQNCSLDPNTGWFQPLPTKRSPPKRFQLPPPPRNLPPPHPPRSPTPLPNLRFPTGPVHTPPPANHLRTLPLCRNRLRLAPNIHFPVHANLPIRSPHNFLPNLHAPLQPHTMQRHRTCSARSKSARRPQQQLLRRRNNRHASRPVGTARFSCTLARDWV